MGIIERHRMAFKRSKMIECLLAAAIGGIDGKDDGEYDGDADKRRGQFDINFLPQTDGRGDTGQPDNDKRLKADDLIEIADDVPIGRKFIENATLTSMCLLHARRDATVVAGEQMYDRQAEMVRMSPYQRHKRNLVDAEEILESMSRYRYALLYYFMPAAERVSDLLYREKALHEAIITISAIQQWRLEKDGYPENLDELVEGGFLKELPIDPWSDKPLVYKKTDDSFTLYSVSRNFVDDGGEYGVLDSGRISNWLDNGDSIFWPQVNMEQIKINRKRDKGVILFR